MTQKVNLANFILGLNSQTAQFPEMVYRASGAVDYCAEQDSLAFEGSIDFTTYFNALSLSKWRKYTVVRDAYLHIELAGDPCTIVISSTRNPVGFEVKNAKRLSTHTSNIEIGGKAAEVEKSLMPEGHHHINEHTFSGSASFTPLDIPVPDGDFTLVGVRLESEGATEVRNAYWYANVDESLLRDINIAIAMTTFRKEEYAKANIDALQSSIFSDASLANYFHMYVVDNGRTLDANSLSDEHVTVIPSANVGGAGGFARGMMAALNRESVNSGRKFTHVLLMDDDIQVFPESLARTYNLLRLRNDAYEYAFLNGAMLSTQQPNLQFEDVAHVTQSGNYRRVKPTMHMDELANVTRNEELDVEVPNAYGAWWYSCIPVQAIEQNGLPLPVFVRCDDVEFGVRNAAKYMTLNGICVWHDSFGDKFNATMAYQSYRNQLVMDALHGTRRQSLVPIIIERALRTQLRNMNYDAAELIVQSIEDFLRGPDFLMQSNGEELLLEHNEQGEKLVPLQQAIDDAVRVHPELRDLLDGFAPDATALEPSPAAIEIPMKAIRLLPYDKHRLPDALLRNVPATIYFGENLTPVPAQVATRVLVACDREGEKAHVRVMDRERWSAIRDRWYAAISEFRDREEGLRKAYRESLPEMTSATFWEEYLDRANVAS